MRSAEDVARQIVFELLAYPENTQANTMINDIDKIHIRADRRELLEEVRKMLVETGLHLTEEFKNNVYIPCEVVEKVLDTILEENDGA